MARVVQRRSSSTVVYVLVAFVILFLISTVIATLQYMEADELAVQVKQQQEQLDRLASSTDLNKARIAAMMKDGDDTVIQTLTDRIDRLTNWIDADAAGFQAALDQWEDLRQTDQKITQDDPEAPTAAGGLVPLVETLRGRLDAANKAEEQVAVELQNCRREVSERESTIATLKQEHSAAVEELRSQISKQNEMLKSRETSHERALSQAREESNAIQKDLRARIEDLATQIDDLQIALNLKEQQIKELEDKLRGPTGKGDGKTAVVQAEPDGKIIKVIEADDVCYIDVGSRDGVKVGMPFSVYPDKGVPPEGDGKARIVVRNTDKYSSECQILTQEKGKPLVRGDVVSNLAFNAMATPTFVVRGEFDLFGEGTATAENARIVKDLIKRFGGKVTDELSVQTDYLVLGTEPARPIKPEEDTEDQGEYQQKLREYTRYQDLKDEARRLGIPVLNTTRFLAHTGYKPQKTLKY
ncbi:MAG: BRCT domain-containing protein [Phycisphaerae bacterium]